MIRRRLVLAAALLVSVAYAPAARADTTVASLPGPTPVRSWQGTSVLSLLDPASGLYRLAVMRGTAAPRPLPGIAPARRAFDANIGPGPDGSPLIVFARCARLCHLFRTTPAGGSAAPIRGATSPRGSETAPSVWFGGLAFARTYRRGSTQVYVRPLNAPKTVRSRRLPGVPATDCDLGRPCGPVTRGRVPELELRGSQLAEIVHFPLRSEGICGEFQVRLLDVRRRSDVLVRHAVCGLSGQTIMGLSWAGARLLFAQTCPGDPSGCGGGALAYRYSPGSRRLESVSRPEILTGFTALDADHDLEVQAVETGDVGRCDNFIAGAPRPPCPLSASGPLAFHRAR